MIMRQERKDSVFDNFFMPIAVNIVCVVIGSVLTYFKIKSSDPAYVFHDIITYDNISDIIETYFVDYGLVDSSILELDAPQEQMQVIRELIQEQQKEKNTMLSQLKDLLLTMGYDSETVDAMNENEMLEMLSSYLVSTKADTDALSLQYAELQQEYDELSSKTLAELRVPALVIEGESITTTLRDYVAVINGKNYYQETLLNSYILDEQLSVKEGVLYYAESAPERVKAVTDVMLHDNDRFEIQKESSEYTMGTKECTYGLVNKQWADGCAEIYVECGGEYSKIEFGLGHVNDSGDGDKTLNIYYMNANGEYELAYTKELHADMRYEEGISVDIFNTSTVKIEYKGSYGAVRYGMTDIYLVK